MGIETNRISFESEVDGTVELEVPFSEEELKGLQKLIEIKSGWFEKISEASGGQRTAYTRLAAPWGRILLYRDDVIETLKENHAFIRKVLKNDPHSYVSAGIDGEMADFDETICNTFPEIGEMDEMEMIKYGYY